MIYQNVIIVGGGLAGLRAAIAVNQNNVSVGLISKVHPVRSHSGQAQGGINAAMGAHVRGANDSYEKHAFDTVKGSDYLADQDAVMQLVKDAPARIIEMEHWGCPFSRTPEGRIAQRPFGGAGFPRTCYAADKTGHALLHTLYEQVVKFELSAEREQMKFYDEWFVLSLIVEEGVARGVIAMEMTSGRIEEFHADAVVIATGGAGRMYGKTTNAHINTGMGMAIPYWVGSPLKDMEFIQFHPTTLYGTNILMTEGCRGEGGFLINKDGDRFLANYEDSRKAMEVAPRDIVSRNMRNEILAGKGFENAYLGLDLRHLGEDKINERLPGIREIAIKFANCDPVKDLLPVVPAQHYTMGGIDCDSNGASSSIKGLYAAGEAACVSVHGANRLGGNSLLETIVYGEIAGRHAAEYVFSGQISRRSEAAVRDARKKAAEWIASLYEPGMGEKYGVLKSELNEAMDEDVGIFRDKEGLTRALNKVGELRSRYKNLKITSSKKNLNFDLMWAMELKGNIDVAEAVVAGALAREESRGSQSRLDFPQRNDDRWLKHTIAYYTEDGPRLEYKNVTLGLWEPKERKY